MNHDRSGTLKTLFDASAVIEMKARIAQLRPESERQWGKMNPAQALAHCAAGLKLALGDITPPKTLIGWTIGPMVKKMVFRDEEPLRRNSPTVKGLVVEDDRNLAIERDLLFATIDRFVAAGPDGCTDHPHSYFGRLTPQEWGALMYKHLDHHLRQFAV
jgi:hypothetical protein